MENNTTSRGPLGLIDPYASSEAQEDGLTSNAGKSLSRGPAGINQNAGKLEKYNISISGHAVRNRMSGFIESLMIDDEFGGKILPNVTWYDHTDVTTALRQKEADLGGKGLLDKQGEESAKWTTHNLKNPIKCSADIHIFSQGRGERVETVTLTITGAKGIESLTRSMDMEDKKLTFEKFETLAKETARKALTIAHRLH